MIDKHLAAFLQEGVGIHIATRNAALQPNGTRALAVTVESDGLHVVVYAAEVAAARVLPDLEDNAQIAIGFGRPTDDRACQVKGIVIGTRVATEDERSVVAAQWDGFLGSLEQIGIPRVATRTWVTWPAVAIRVRVNALFDQTPGPGAGAPIV